MGLDVADFDARLRCCLLHIGSVHLAYNAFLGDDETLLLTDRRMYAASSTRRCSAEAHADRAEVLHAGAVT